MSVGKKSALGKGEISSLNSFTNQEIFNSLTTYRKLVANSYAFVGSDEILGKLSMPLMVSTKIDGELWFLLFDKEWLLVAANGRVISGEVDCLVQAKAAKLETDAIYAGELSVISEKRSRIADLSILLGAGAKAKTDALVFTIFDVVSSKDVSALGTNYSVRYEKLSKLPETKNLNYAKSVKTNSANEVMDLFEQEVTGQGAEGLVARAEDSRNFKVKATRDLDATILGFTEKRDAEGTVMIRSLLLGLITEASSWIPITTTGNVGNEQLRKELYQQLKGQVVSSSYRRTSQSSGILYQFVKPATVVELKCMDIQLEDSKGEMVRHPLIAFESDHWKVVGWSNSAAIHNSVLIRIRSDKSPVFSEAGWGQIQKHLPISNEVSNLKVGQSEVIKRQVWTKEGSGKTDVRKLLVWKTNKEGFDYPNYVVHWTDYSATRKSPLDREVRLAPTEAEALKLAEMMIAENIKKGWVEKT
jgi:hypothetical protein